MSRTIDRRNFIKRGVVTASSLSVLMPAVSAGRDSEAQHQIPDPLRCSFCSKSQDDVKKLIAGPSVYICDECVDVCQSIIADKVETESDAPPETLPSDTAYVCSLCTLALPPEQTRIIRGRGTIVCNACIDAIIDTVTNSP